MKTPKIVLKNYSPLILFSSERGDVSLKIIKNQNNDNMFSLLSDENTWKPTQKDCNKYKAKIELIKLH